MEQYLDTLVDVLDTGWDRMTRATLDGKYVPARTKFGREMRFDLSNGKFPIVTTKAVSFRMIALELAGFIAATRDVHDFDDVHVPIWDANASAPWWEKFKQFEGDTGRIYGVEWRGFPSPWSKSGEVDQLAWILRMLKENPNERRMIMTAWNPASIQENKVCLPPCHVLVHFDIIDGKLNLFMYQRSCDMLLGVPYNISSYALLAALVAHLLGYPLGEFIHYLGDYHIYHNHFESVKEQLKRKPMELPTLWINPAIKNIDDFRLDKMLVRVMTEDDFISGKRKPQEIIDDYVKLVDYKHHPKLPGDQRMAV